MVWPFSPISLLPASSAPIRNQPSWEDAAWEPAADRDLGTLPTLPSAPPHHRLPLTALSKETKDGGKALKGTGTHTRAGAPGEGPAWVPSVPVWQGWGQQHRPEGDPGWRGGILGLSPLQMQACVSQPGSMSEEPGVGSGFKSVQDPTPPPACPSVHPAGSASERKGAKSHQVRDPPPGALPEAARPMCVWAREHGDLPFPGPSQGWPPARTPKTLVSQEEHRWGVPAPALHAGPQLPTCKSAEWTVSQNLTSSAFYALTRQPPWGRRQELASRDHGTRAQDVLWALISSVTTSLSFLLPILHRPPERLGALQGPPLPLPNTPAPGPHCQGQAAVVLRGKGTKPCCQLGFRSW